MQKMQNLKLFCPFLHQQISGTIKDRFIIWYIFISLKNKTKQTNKKKTWNSGEVRLMEVLI